MPNWCLNNLKIVGEVKELKKFEKKVDKENFLGSFIPLPKELEERQSPSKTTNTVNPTKEDLKENIEKNRLKKLYGSDNWYDWSIKNWGTKWDMNEVCRDDDEELDAYEEDEQEEVLEIQYAFSSPWSPPIKGLESISKLFPNLTFHLDYSEDGMGYRGISRFQDGNTEDYCID